MASLITTVDRQSGNYENVFIYTVNASFNGVQGDINSAKIKIFIPDYLNLFLGDVREPVKNVSEVPVEGGRELTYDFGAITDLGISVRIGFGVTFKTEALNGETFLCTSKMIINDEEIISYESQEISLQLESRFEISREIVLPIATPSAGSTVYYKVTLKNYGDLGALIENVRIVCNGSEFVTLDSSFSAVGKDVSSKFADKTKDGVEGVFENNRLIFTLDSYKGETYEFIYRAIIDESLEVGSELTTIANFSIDSINQEDELHEVTLASPIYDASISLYAPDYSLQDEYICYRMGLSNTGNQILLNVTFENDLPPEINYYEFSTGAFNISAINQSLSAEYFIDYETVNGVTGRLGPFNTDVNTKVDLTEFIDENDNLSILYWRLESLRIGVSSRILPQLLGIVKSEVPLDSSVINHIHLSFDEEGEEKEKVQNATTLIANYCTLNPTVSSSVDSNPVRPNDTIRFTFSANCRSSRLLNPIFAFLMPKEFEYVGEEEYIYSDIFTDVNPPEPSVKLIPNFNENGDTLLKFEFRDENAFSFRQLAGIKISFDAKVAVGAYGEVEYFLLLNTKGSTGIIPNSVDIYIDNKNIAEDSTVSRNYAKSNILSNQILYFVSTSSNKKVKGFLDTEYIEEPNVGKTFNAGSLEYLITVRNIGNANLEELEIVDILPHIGDKGVIETGTSRNSEFPIYALSEVAAVIVPTQEEVEFDILYSQSIDPVRFGGNFDVIGTDDDWSVEAPLDLSLLKAFKVKVKNAVLYPNQSLKVSITASVPVGVPSSAIAWNSFAADVAYTNLNGEKQHLLAIEPEKVGIEVVDTDPNLGRIAGFSWVDDGDGVYEESEDLVNDVVAVLYDEEGNLLRFTSTRTDLEGNDGQYAFENLELKKYYLKFFIDDKNLKFTKQVLDDENGSKADRKTGITPIFDLAENKEIEDANIGIMPKDKYTLEEITKINNQARGVLRDVIKNQMLLTMKQEDVIEIIENDLL